MTEFTHLDDTGQLRMVDVGDKAETRRQATAACRVIVGPKVFPLLQAGRLPKGDVWAAARLAGIMAAKNTAQLIPLCHTLPLTGVEVVFSLEPQEWQLASQPSPGTVLPSSHSSPGSTVPSPQCGRVWQFSSQVTPSGGSHSSPSSTKPSPQIGIR